MARVVGIDHLVIRVKDFERSKKFYDTVLGFLGFKRKYNFDKTAGWSNGKTLYWIGEANARASERYVAMAPSVAMNGVIRPRVMSRPLSVPRRGPPRSMTPAATRMGPMLDRLGVRRRCGGGVHGEDSQAAQEREH